MSPFRCRYLRLACTPLVGSSRNRKRNTPLGCLEKIHGIRWPIGLPTICWALEREWASEFFLSSTRWLHSYPSRLCRAEFGSGVPLPLQQIAAPPLLVGLPQARSRRQPETGGPQLAIAVIQSSHKQLRNSDGMVWALKASFGKKSLIF